jgi:hypothetical protein
METQIEQAPRATNKRKKKTLTLSGQPPWLRFYYGGKWGYAMQTAQNEFIPLCESQVRQHLKMLKVSPGMMDQFLCEIREQHYVVWIGPVAGYQSGIYLSDDSQSKFLATIPPKIIKGVPGDFDLINRIISGLFDDKEQPDQLPMVLGWLKQGRANVVLGKPRPLPALALVGPRKAGKTLFLEIGRHVLGGRKTAAYHALTNQQGFNSELLGAELLTVDDEVASNDPRARIRFGQAIKKNFFSGSFFVHGKGKEGFCARPVHALAIAVNNEPQHVRVLPDLDESLVDKIALIQTGMASVSVEESSDREGFMARILSEIPAFIHFIENFEVPESLKDERSGIKAFHHPDILYSLMQLSGELRLLELIHKNDMITSAIENDSFWKGTALELEQIITSCPINGPIARSLFSSYQGAAGQYLSRLVDAKRFGVSKAGQKKGIMQYRIGPSSFHEHDQSLGLP